MLLSRCKCEGGLTILIGNTKQPESTSLGPSLILPESPSSWVHSPLSPLGSLVPTLLGASLPLCPSFSLPQSFLDQRLNTPFHTGEQCPIGHRLFYLVSRSTHSGEIPAIICLQSLNLTIPSLLLGNNVSRFSRKLKLSVPTSWCHWKGTGLRGSAGPTWGTWQWDLRYVTWTPCTAWPHPSDESLCLEPTKAHFLPLDGINISSCECETNLSEKHFNADSEPSSTW